MPRLEDIINELLRKYSFRREYYRIFRFIRGTFETGGTRSNKGSLIYIYARRYGNRHVHESVVNEHKMNFKEF